MLNNLERDTFNVVDKADTPITLSEGITINQQYNDLYTKDYNVDMQHNLFKDTATKLNELGFKVQAPSDSFINNLLDSQAYNRGKKEIFDAVVLARLQNPDDQELKLIPANDWATAMLLPVEQFVGSSKQKVWQDSLRG